MKTKVERNQSIDDDFDASSSHSTNFSMDENASEGCSSKMASTPCSEINNIKGENSQSQKNRSHGVDAIGNQEKTTDNKLFLNNRFLSQLENLEKIIWNYKLQENVATKKSHTASLPKEFVFKILM